jgi:hypothetical protein
LGKNATGWDGSRIKLVFEFDVEARVQRSFTGFRERHIGKIGDWGFASVQGETQSDGRGDEHHHEKDEDAESEAEAMLHLDSG